MAEVRKKSAGSFQKGDYIIIEGSPSIVTSIQISRPGKHGHAKVRLEAVGMIDEKKRQILVPGHDELDVPIIEKKKAQILSISGDIANVMDMENYETFDMKIPEEIKREVVEGCTILYWQILNDKIMKQIVKKEE